MPEKTYVEERVRKTSETWYNRCMNGKISIVGTPIGNLEDLTFRALRTLREADVIVCEDTRVTAKLLAKYEVQKPLISIHEHSEERDLRRVVDRVKEGERVVYVSDAGTPGVNDPGGKLAALAYQEGVRLEPVPGASALTTAISVCGFPMDTFTYLGFLPHKKGRATIFAQIVQSDDPVVFLESTHRIQKTISALRDLLHPGRQVFIGRELTKIHETLYRGTIDEVSADLQATSQKGEFVIIIGPSV